MAAAKGGARQCVHCKAWVEPGEPHNCAATTERALTEDLTDDLQDAWQRLRETAAEFGDQRIYASHHSIMFSRRTCYFFVRPKRSFLEVCIFAAHAIRSPLVLRSEAVSKTRVANFVRVLHRDQVEPPMTDWLREAYELQDVHPTPSRAPVRRSRPQSPSARSARTRRTKR